MAVSPRTIKRRIKSVANTRKITKAMELVAASKMRKSVQLVQTSRTYSNTVQELVKNIRPHIHQAAHPLLGGRAMPQSTMLLVAASDRGLCGGFNTQLLKKTFEFLKSRSEHIQLVTIGRRAEQAVRRAGYIVTAAFEAISNAPSFARSVPVGEYVYTQFMSGEAHRVFVAYMDFRNAVSQIPTVMQLLPIIPEGELVDLLHSEEEGSDVRKKKKKQKFQELELLFEPDPERVLDALLPRLLETQVYQCLLESSASEHSARMLAMRNATDNASSMLEDLTFTFNQARQAAITQEISEISAGKAAIE